MAAKTTTPQENAIAYHERLAADWEQRYRKPTFRARLRAFAGCLDGHDIRGETWLDAGCGSGTLARRLAAEGARVLGVDASEEMIARARQLAEAEPPAHDLRFESIGDIARLSLKESSLDGVLCSSVLEYVADPGGCLAEFARVLRRGGLLLISVPNRCSMVRRAQVAGHRLGAILGRQWFRFLDHSRHEYTGANFCALLGGYGFDAQKVIYFGSPIPGWLQRRKWGGSLILFRATRM